MPVIERGSAAVTPSGVEEDGEAAPRVFAAGSCVCEGEFFCSLPTVGGVIAQVSERAFPAAPPPAIYPRYMYEAADRGPPVAGGASLPADRMGRAALPVWGSVGRCSSARVVASQRRTATCCTCDVAARPARRRRAGHDCFAAATKARLAAPRLPEPQPGDRLPGDGGDGTRRAHTSGVGPP